MKKGIFHIILIAFFSFASTAHALTVLKDVNVYDGERVDLKFDRGIKEKQIKTEFFRDIIQISINDVAVYPAKIFSVDGESLRKVFAYQYSPNLIRCRLTVKGNAERYKSLIKIGLKDRVLSIEIPKNAASNDKIMLQSAQAIKNGKNSNSKKINTPIKEKALLQEVLGRRENKNQHRLTNGKKVEFPARNLVWLVLVALAGMVILWALKKAKKTNRNFNRKILNRNIFQWMGRLGIQRGSNLDSIRIISSEDIGPNARITIVEINQKRMVLGVTSENINLISSGEEDSVSNPPSSAVSAGPATFSDVIQEEIFLKPKRSLSKELSVRDRIRKRIEGMKAL